jgi:hypothetical protein
LPDKILPRNLSLKRVKQGILVGREDKKTLEYDE